MNAETPAAVLKRAAEHIRALATATYIRDEATAPWHVEECDSSEAGDCACIVAQGYHSHPGAPRTGVSYVADAETPEYAAFIAALHPGVGVALADWLEAVTSRARHGGAEWVGADLHHALAVARAVLGEDAPAAPSDVEPRRESR